MPGANGIPMDRWLDHDPGGVQRRAAIVYWNSTYIVDAIAHLQDRGQPVPQALLAHTSPLAWEHIGFSGDFLWDQAAATAGHRRQRRRVGGLHGRASS